MLIGQEKGDPLKVPAYQSLCMLGSAGKLLEKLMKLN